MHGYQSQIFHLQLRPCVCKLLETGHSKVAKSTGHWASWPIVLTTASPCLCHATSDSVSPHIQSRQLYLEGRFVDARCQVLLEQYVVDSSPLVISPLFKRLFGYFESSLPQMGQKKKKNLQRIHKICYIFPKPDGDFPPRVKR